MSRSTTCSDFIVVAVRFYEDETTEQLSIVTSCAGRSFRSVWMLPIRLMTSMPWDTRPNTVCLPSRCAHGASVTKNCEPLVLGPAFAEEMIPAPTCFRSLGSSSNFSP